jgi:drug/metabolite transporter (DMT)-like permease
MKISNQAKGYLYAVISVIAVSNVYIFSKAALREISLPQFGAYWFLFGLLWILLFAWYRKSFTVFKTLKPKSILILVFLGVFEVVGTYFFFKAIHTITNPTIVSFIGNIGPVIVISLSILILKDRFNTLELIGMFLTITGAFVISYKGNTNLENLFINGSQYILYSALFGATNAIIIKRNIKSIPPIVLTVNRTLFLFLFSLIALQVSNNSVHISMTAFKNIFVGSILGPFLTVIAGYLALQYIPLSRKAIIGSTKGLFVLLGSYLYFGQFPKTITLIGGLVTIIGLILISVGKMKLKK